MFLTLFLIGILSPILKRQEANYQIISGPLEILYIVIVSYFVNIIDTYDNVNLDFVLKRYLVIAIVINFIMVVLERVLPTLTSAFMLKVYRLPNMTFAITSYFENKGSFLRASGLLFDAVVFGAICLIFFQLIPFVKTKMRPWLF